jgi:large subunit ribosomal protein L30e
MSIEKEVRNALKEKRIVIGSRSVIRGIRNRAFSGVFFADNCPEGTRKDLTRYGELAGTEVSPFNGNSAQLGQLCGKPFNILLIGIKK